MHVGTAAVQRYVRSDARRQLVKVYMGVRAFERTKVNYSETEIYRITQDASECLFDCISADRKVKLALDELMWMVRQSAT